MDFDCPCDLKSLKDAFNVDANREVRVVNRKGHTGYNISLSRVCSQMIRSCLLLYQGRGLLLWLVNH